MYRTRRIGSIEMCLPIYASVATIVVSEVDLGPGLANERAYPSITPAASVRFRVTLLRLCCGFLSAFGPPFLHHFG
jgi:hypothetical protein